MIGDLFLIIEICSSKRDKNWPVFVPMIGDLFLIHWEMKLPGMSTNVFVPMIGDLFLINAAKGRIKYGTAEFSSP